MIMQVVHVSTYTSGGAGIAALRLNQALLQEQIDSALITLVKTSSDLSVRVIQDYGTSVEPSVNPAVNVAVDNWNKTIADAPNRPWGLELFSNPDSKVRLQNLYEIQQADIVHLHWVAGLADYEEMAQALVGKKIVWTLHDMNPFTGGCHYAGSCTRYMHSCGACPQLGSEIEGDVSRRNWTKKYKSIQQLDITVVTPSRWLAQCVAQSSIFGNARVVTIPNGIPTNVFKPHNRNDVRKILDIPQDAKVILFGADSIANTRKGFVYLLEALKRYQSQHYHKVVLVTFGSISSLINQDLQFPLVQLGQVGDESQLACIYSMADITVIPSLEDNLPNIVLESMSCGTPVIGFNIGGIPDMIDHLVTGYLAHPKDIDDLVAGIQWMLINASPDMGKRCRDKVIKCFSQKSLCQRMNILYTSLCSSLR